MKDKLLIFDLDGTLLDTRRTKPYRKSQKGFDFLLRNHGAELITRVNKIFGRSLVRIFNRYSSVGGAVVCTNSPRNYARILLDEFGFVLGYPSLIHAADKPHSSRLNDFIKARSIDPRNVLSIGDAATDILASHGAGIASVAVTWGDDSKNQLSRSEPQRIAEKPDDLEEAIIQFEKGEFGYEERKFPKDFRFLRGIGEINDGFNPNDVFYLGEYFPYGCDDFDEFSGRILDFKEIKNHSLSEINKESPILYFAGDKLRRSNLSMLQLVHYFKSRVVEKLSSLNLVGKTLLIGAPNSFPEFCYKIDTNHRFVQRTSEELGEGFSFLDERLVSRVYPLKESHLGPRNTVYDHFRTMGFKSADICDYGNVVIFDDITTTSSQLRSIHAVLRHIGYGGNIYAITLGKTRSLEPIPISETRDKGRKLLSDIYS